MSALGRWMQALRLLPPSLAVALPGLGPFLARRRFPRAQGEVAVPGLHRPVSVVRDRWGVPHLYAEDEHDLFFAQGYVHAQDRLFQMELGRRIGEGTLSAALGPTALGIDRLTRTLGLARHAEASWIQSDGECCAMLAAYAGGVNARLSEPLPLEFTLLGLSPTPWSPISSLLRANLLAFALSGNHRLELLRAALIAAVGEGLTAHLLSPHALEIPFLVPPRKRDAAVTKMEGLDGVDRFLGEPDLCPGSNAWVVHGSRTASGKPLLANDAPVALGLPSTWYENGLHGGRFDGVGFSLPGVPLLVLGHNGHLAWGLSNLGADTQDFYREKLDHRHAPRRYEFRGAWHDLTIVREVIEVRGEAPVPLEIRSTGHGPLMNEALGPLLGDAEPLSLRWTLGECAPLPRALLRLNLAKDWDEFRAALSHWEIPGQSFVYADGQGNIGYQATGKIPVRAPGHQGLEPVPGWTGDHEWQGFIPFADLPSACNPAAGFVATSNNKVTADDYPYLIAHHWSPAYRAQRITDLLAASDRHTLDDMRRIQAETYSLPAEALRPYLLAVPPASDEEARALAEVRSWDLRYETDRVGATIFQAWYVHLLRHVLDKQLGPEPGERYLAREYERLGSLHLPMMVALLAHPHDPRFHHPRRGPAETRDALVRRAFVDAVAWLRHAYGPDVQRWTWGEVHTLTLEHAPLGQVGFRFLRRLFNSRPLPARGDGYTVDSASFLWSDPFSVVHGTAQRMIVDLGDLSRSIAVHTPGQSEHLHHPHRDDLMELAQRVQYHPLLFTRKAVDEQAEATLKLVPRGTK